MKKDQTNLFRDQSPIWYKNRYIIAFYEDDDETHFQSFDNVWDICRYKNLEINERNIRNLRNELCFALKRESHRTKMLNGNLMRVYLIDMIEEI